jgi:hypothetical protein
MTTIPSLATAEEVKALVDAKAVSAKDAALFIAQRFGRKVRDGKAVTGHALDVFSGLMGLTPDTSKGFAAYREATLAIAKGLAPEAFEAKPKASAKTTGKAAPAKASAKGKAAPAKRGRSTAPAKAAADAPFTDAQVKAIAAIVKAALA